MLTLQLKQIFKTDKNTKEKNTTDPLNFHITDSSKQKNDIKNKQNKTLINLRRV